MISITLTLTSFPCNLKKMDRQVVFFPMYRLKTVFLCAQAGFLSGGPLIYFPKEQLNLPGESYV